MTIGYDLPDKFYDKMTLRQQLRYLRKHKIPVPIPLKLVPINKRKSKNKRRAK